MLGAWPCGTIAMLGALYGAESKTQVYGQLHTLIARDNEATSQLGKAMNEDLTLHNIIIESALMFCRGHML